MQSEPPPRKLLDRVRDQVRVKHYSYRTEETYVQWIRRFILFHNKRHPSEMDGDEVNAFLTHLAVNETVEETLEILKNLTGVYQIVAKLLYSSGLRLNEALSLRVKDIDFAQQQIIVRDSKGLESRITILPQNVVEQLKEHLQQVKLTHQQDLDRVYGETLLPFALQKKYPNAAKEWI